MKTSESHTPRTLKMWFMQKVLGFNRQAYWPMHFTSKVNQPRNILVGIDTCPGYEPGCYIQGLGRVIIGDYTAVAQNVGIISANNLPENPKEHDRTETTSIGSYCWIGMNAVILPGVHLGDFTVVGAGSVVTKSFPDGHCIIAGNPARKIRDLLPEDCVRHEHQFRYVGYLRANDFDNRRKRFVWF